MACCPAASPLSPHTNNIDEGIEFEKRTSKLYTIYLDYAEDNPRTNDVEHPLIRNHAELPPPPPPRGLLHRVTLEDWSKQYEASERNLARKEQNCSSSRIDLYQILGLFFVFQGVILTAVAQANYLRCHNWILPFFLCLLTSIAAFFAALQKLKENMVFTEQCHLEKANYIALHKSVEELKERGIDFDVEQGQPELKRYTEPDLMGTGSFADVHSGFQQFCSVWVISYAGAVLFLLFLFSALTLFSVHQILCNPGTD